MFCFIELPSRGPAALPPLYLLLVSSVQNSAETLCFPSSADFRLFSFPPSCGFAKHAASRKVVDWKSSRPGNPGASAVERRREEGEGWRERGSSLEAGECHRTGPRHNGRRLKEK